MELELKQAVAQLEVATNEIAKLKAEYAKAIDGKASNETMDSLKSEVSEKSAQITKLSEQLDALEAKTNVTEQGTKLSVKTKIENALKAKFEDIKTLQSGNSRSNINVDVKAASDIVTVANSYTGGVVGLTDFDAERARLVRRMPFIRNLIRVRTTTLPYISWAEQLVSEGDAAMTAEGAAKAQVSMKWVERSEKAKKITAYMKASKESLADLSYMAAEINDELVYKINKKLDSQLLVGDGTGENLKGILSYATTFAVAGTPLVDAIANANYFDVLRSAVAKIAVVGDGEFMPNYALINPYDAAILDMQKGTNGHYVLPPFMTQNGNQIAGVTLVENTGVTAGTYVVGDFSKSVLGVREEINIDLGYENDDFTKNLVTILGEMRAYHYVKTNHAGAFIKGTFATDLALIGV